MPINTGLKLIVAIRSVCIALCTSFKPHCHYLGLCHPTLPHSTPLRGPEETRWMKGGERGRGSFFTGKQSSRTVMTTFPFS